MVILAYIVGLVVFCSYFVIFFILYFLVSIFLPFFFYSEENITTQNTTEGDKKLREGVSLSKPNLLSAK